MTDAEREELRTLIRDTISTEFAALREAAEIAALAASCLEHATERMADYPGAFHVMTRREFTAMSEQLLQRIRQMQMRPAPTGAAA